MSRIGKSPIILNKNVDIDIKKNDIKIKGPKGQLEYSLPNNITVQQREDKLIIETLNDNKW